MTHHAMTRTDALVAFLARMLIAWRRPLDRRGPASERAAARAAKWA